MSVNRLTKLLVEEEGISQRATAKMIGVGVGTINRDLDDVPSGTIKENIDFDNQNIIKEIVPSGTPPEIPAWINESGQAELPPVVNSEKIILS